MNMRRLTHRAVLTVLAAGSCAGLAQAQTTFYSQNFDSAVPNQQSGDPRMLQDCLTSAPRFSKTLPTGWVNDFCGIATFFCTNPTTCTSNPFDLNCSGFPANTTFKTRPGKFEWEGWSVANTQWWATAAGGQQRGDFTKSTGNCLVADPDDFQGDGSNEADPFPFGTYNAFATTPAVSLANADLSTLVLTFDSSWRPEGFDDGPVGPNGYPTNNQTARIEAIYTVGGVDQPPVQVLQFDSDDGSTDPGVSPFFKADSTNESVTITNLQAPAGATEVKFRISLTNALNDWWWAVDNFVLKGTVNAVADSTIWSENFDAVPLQAPVDVVPSGCATQFCADPDYTLTPPGGMTVINGTTTTGGVPDWRGWSFVRPEYHACLEGNGAQDFVAGSGIIAVANGDRFTDLPGGGDLDTTLATPAFSIATRTSDTLLLTFASSWRWEDLQTAQIFADYTTPSGTVTVTVLDWTSVQASPNFKPDATNEQVNIPLAVPTDATSMQLRFKYVGGNDWWWAIDNLRVIQGQASVTYAVLNPLRGPMALNLGVDYSNCAQPWGVTPPTGWTWDLARCGTCPITGFCGVPEFSGWSFADKDWWVQIQGNQRRVEFTRGRGRLAIADGDTYDDLANGQTQIDTLLTTPAIPLPGSLGSLALNFDSSWRPEGFDDASTCDPAPPAANIVSILNDTNGFITVQTATPHGLLSGQWATIVDPVVQPIIGRVRVQVINPTTFTFPGVLTTESPTGTAGTRTVTRRPTNNQTAVVTAIYTLADSSTTTREVIRWDSDGTRGPTATNIFVPAGPFFKPDAVNEGVSLNTAQLQVPAGATSVKFQFGYIKARNDWWWAIDNVNVLVNGAVALSEGFETVANTQNILTQPAPTTTCQYFAPVSLQPGALVVDNAGAAGCPDGPFKGWNSWLVDAWAKATGGGPRLAFASANAYVSDFSAAGCTGTSILTSPDYSIASANPGSLTLQFRSGWGTGANHNSRLEYSFDGGATWTVGLNWTPATKMSTADEVVRVRILNTASTSTVRFRFVDENSGYWAISNIELTGVVGEACTADFNQDGNATIDDIFIYLNAWFGNCTGDNLASPCFGRNADVNNNGLNIDDIFIFLNLWFAGCN